MNFTQIRTEVVNTLHALGTVAGGAAMVTGLVTEWINTSGTAIPQGVRVWLIGAGGAVLMVSKGIDSFNNAVTSKLGK